MSTVFIPTVLRPNVGGAKRLDLDGDTIRARRRRARDAAPGPQPQLLTDQGDLNRFVNVYVNGQDVRYLAGSRHAGRARRRSPPAAGDGRRLTVAVPAAPAEADRRARPRPRPRERWPHGGRYADILEAIGHTPLVEIPRMSPNPDVRIFAKLEMLNPTGSVKDRVAKYLIEDLEARGLLHEDSIILEPTSGNTGIALAMIGRRKGYRVALVMPDNVTQRAATDGRAVRRRGDRLAGALGSNGAIALAKHLVAKDERFVMPYQYGNPANPRAHYETTGPEILADCPEIDVFVAGIGTGGHADGRRRATCASRSRASGSSPPSHSPGSRSRACARSRKASSRRSSTRRCSTRSTSSRTATRSPRCATSSSRRGSSAGRRAGRSSSPRLARRQTMTSGTIVALLPDGGWKYLSAGTFSANLDEMDEALEGGVNWW